MDKIPKYLHRKYHKYILDFSEQPRKSYMRGTQIKSIRKPIEYIAYRRLRQKKSTLMTFNPSRQGHSRVKTKSGKKDNPIYKSKMTFSKACEKLFETIAEETVNNEGGVYLKDLAYFSAEVHVNNEGPQEAMRLKMYSDFIRNSPLKHMTMDRAFAEEVKLNFSNSIFRGKKHYNYLNYIKDERKRVNK